MFASVSVGCGSINCDPHFIRAFCPIGTIVLVVAVPLNLINSYFEANVFEVRFRWLIPFSRCLQESFIGIIYRNCWR